MLELSKTRVLLNQTMRRKQFMDKAASQQKKLWLKQSVTVPFWKKDIPRSGPMRLDGFASGLRTRILALRSARARTFTSRMLKPFMANGSV
ncbi:hypothetical protein EMCRGX_G002610 [Ephydatia muelleri]